MKGEEVDGLQAIAKETKPEEIPRTASFSFILNLKKLRGRLKEKKRGSSARMTKALRTV